MALSILCRIQWMSGESIRDKRPAVTICRTSACLYFDSSRIRYPNAGGSPNVQAALVHVQPTWQRLRHLFIKPVRKTSPTDIAKERNLPVPLRRRASSRDLKNAGASNKDKYKSLFYAPWKSLAIWTTRWAGHPADEDPVPPSQIIVADLSKWEAYLPPRDKLAVDPVLGRIVFPPRQLPPQSVRVSYHYGFSADIGGGQYERRLSAPQGQRPFSSVNEECENLTEAKEKWLTEPRPQHAVIEVTDNRAYREAIRFDLLEGQLCNSAARTVAGP